MDKPDLPMKAKALAAVENGVCLVRKSEGRYYPVRFVEDERYPIRVAGEAFTYWSTPTEALAAAADALCLSPEPAVVVLTEEEKAILNDALATYAQKAHEQAGSPYHLSASSREYWQTIADQAKSLRQRFVGE